MASVSSEPNRVYAGLAAGAESGMDFSSRWFADSFTEATVDTANVVPVELNAIMCRVEETMAHMYDLLWRDPDRAKQLRRVSVVV